MENQEYVKTLGIDEKAQQICLKHMAKYNENHWWESDDPRTFAYWQLKEWSGEHGCWLTSHSWPEFGIALQILLNRRVLVQEVDSALARKSLLEEAERAWKWGVGCTTEKEGDDRLVENLQRVAEEHPNITVLDLR
jgi:hypothetical protein